VTDVHDELQEIARSTFDLDDLVLTDSTTAKEVPGWDSLAHVSFMYSVEEQFGVRFSEDEFAGFEDIGALKRMISEKQATS
jgi:acyl carrier protein